MFPYSSRKAFPKQILLLLRNLLKKKKPSLFYTMVHFIESCVQGEVKWTEGLRLRVQWLSRVCVWVHVTAGQLITL